MLLADDQKADYKLKGGANWRDYIHFFSKEVIFDQLKCFSNHYHQQLTLNPTQKNLKKNLNCYNDLHYTGLAYHAFYF